MSVQKPHPQPLAYAKSLDSARDHDPTGRLPERRAIQLGLRGDALRRHGTTELLSVTDITDFVAEQRAHIDGDLSSLRVPYEQVYRPAAGCDQPGAGRNPVRSAQDLTHPPEERP